MTMMIPEAPPRVVPPNTADAAAAAAAAADDDDDDDDDDKNAFSSTNTTTTTVTESNAPVPVDVVVANENEQSEIVTVTTTPVIFSNEPTSGDGTSSGHGLPDPPKEDVRTADQPVIQPSSNKASKHHHRVENENPSATATFITTASNQQQKHPTTEQVNTTTTLPVFHLLQLPLDSLHHVAAFLTPTEWRNVAQTCPAARTMATHVWQRVHWHAFQCAAEVIGAWRTGHHGDAQELLALYIQAGVPIYPRSFGYSYRTLVWKMQVEAREMMMMMMMGGNHPRNTGTDTTTHPVVDPFYRERAEFRTAQDYATERLTYVEEKCLYWATRQEEESTSSSSTAVVSSTRPITVRVHPHLLEQHHRRKPVVNDNEGLMITPGVSLSADFYHPNPHHRQRHANIMMMDLQSIPENLAAGTAENVVDPPPPPLPADEPEVDHDFVLVPDVQRRPLSAHKLRQALQACQVETYTAALDALSSSGSAGDDGSHARRHHLKTRFMAYQRRLEPILAHMDHSAFDECLMDMWDEFFPSTAYIQYHDLHTAVPRVSCLYKFLTRPCPKAIGIVQCEIERIRITSRGGKGVSMKGRLFPTYEYRLFIRHRPHNQSPESALDAQEDEEFDRRDTVLMVAKNRGRKHTDISGVASTKKGSNNYFLYMPQQMDVDAHYNKVNTRDEPSKMNANGASLDPVILSEESSSVLMGRLQSNFIGTEFQIFTPKRKKQGSSRKVENPLSAKTVYSPSDDEVDYDSSYSSDTNSNRRSSRLGRFRLGSNHVPVDATPAADLSPSRTRARSVPRSLSAEGGPRRPNRRAIANAEQAEQMSATEEENGVITYTANLLGSRPRIMDVCIPRIGADGVVGAEWRSYLEGLEDGVEEGRMLSCFRQLLQRLENLDPQQPRVDGGAAQEPHQASDEEVAGPTGGGDDFGLLALQNRPPWWNVELGSFVLNFGGRVSVASVKNFQLCDRSDQDNIMLQFGRIHGRHSFTMDFQYPLTAVQAFSIAISSLQSKISFG